MERKESGGGKGTKAVLRSIKLAQQLHNSAEHQLPDN